MIALERLRLAGIHPCGMTDLNISREPIRYCLRRYWNRGAWSELPCRGDPRRCDCPYPNEYQAKAGKPPQERQLPLI